MRLAILTQYYPPEIGAPQARLSELAEYFVRRGHQVTVLTAMPNYPTGRIHRGYGGLLRREQLNGVDVIRTFIYPTQSASFAPRLANYFSFVLSSSIFGSFLLDAPDYLIVESPPLFLGLAGLLLTWLKRTRLIFNVSDLWPESAARLGIVRRDSFAFRLALRLESLCYRRAWLITGQSKSIFGSITRGFPGRRTFLLSNGVDASVFHPNRRTDAARETLTSNREFVVLYAGLHGHAQGLSQALTAAQMLPSDSSIRFVLIGDGPEKKMLLEETRRRRITNISFLGPRPHCEIPPLLAAADAILVPLATPILGAVPSKLYEAMASGRPVLLVANGEAAQIVRASQAGLVVEPGNVSGLAEALQTLRSNPELSQTLGENGRRAALQQFDRERIAKHFAEYLEATLSA